MARFTILLWLAIGLLLACGMAFSDTSTGSVQGFVVDERQDSIIGASVYANTQANAMNSQIGDATDIHGYYLIHGLHPGTWFFRFRSIGYYDTVLTVQIIDDSTVNLNARLNELPHNPAIDGPGWLRPSRKPDSSALIPALRDSQ